jgi:hypothetical protein
MHDIALRLQAMGIDLSKRALQKTFKTVYVAGKKASDQWQMDIGNKKESLTWLLK